MALDPDIQLLILIAFLYLVLPVLVGTSVGMAAGIRFPQVGKLRGACLGLAVGALGIAANVGYGFLVVAFWEWRYPSVVYLSETSARFQHHANYELRETALLWGPGLLAVALALAVWLACWLWKQRLRHSRQSQDHNVV